MLYLKNKMLLVKVNEDHGGDIISIKSLLDNSEFAHRAGLQTWIKSGDNVDPASGVLSNYYAGIPSPKFDVIDQTDTMITLQTIVKDVKILKSIRVTKNHLVVSVTLENLSESINEIPLQVESFCNLAGARLQERENTIIFLAKNNELACDPIYLTKHAQRYVLPFKHNGESIIVANTYRNSYFKISSSKHAKNIALVIHANRLSVGINANKNLLKTGESSTFSLTFSIYSQNITKDFSLPKKTENKALFPSNVNIDSILTGDPAFTERWSHLCLQYDKTEPDYLKKVIEKLLVPLKYNGVVFELNRGVKLKSHPEIAANFAMDIKLVKEIAEFAKSLGLKIAIEFNTPGHQNETNISLVYPELMEPKLSTIPGEVLCISNPKTRTLINDIIMELQETIEPNIFHFGMDEVQFAGYKGTPFGHCELCNKQTPEELFGEYLEWLTSLTKIGVQPAVWGDMFLQDKQFGDIVGGNGSEGHVWKAVSKIPKNTIILDWHYYPTEEYKSLDYFHNLGYEVWPVTAFTFDGLRNFLVYAEKIGIKKAMHTTWSVPNQEKLFIETMFWAGCYHWLGKKADKLPMKKLATHFASKL